MFGMGFLQENAILLSLLLNAFGSRFMPEIWQAASVFG